MNQSVEGLARLAEDGRLEPWLAEKWTLAADGRSLIVTLRAGVKFHDGSPVNATAVAALLPDALKTTLGGVFDEVERVRAIDDHSVEIGFRRRSPLLLESLEVQIRKQGSAIVATGPFSVAQPTELRANTDYYQGPPKIGVIQIATFPAVRTAWAELLRNGLDMLYEVGPDALDSLEGARNVKVFTFTRRYQFAIAFNTQAPALKSSATRRALSMSIDRARLVQAALYGHGEPSSGPIWPRYWALPADSKGIQFDPRGAERILNPGAKASSDRTAHLRFTCLVPSDSMYERIALELKRQFEAVGVDMNVESKSPDQLFEAERSRKFEAAVIEPISGPTLLRLYQFWHSRGAVNPGGFGHPGLDAALDRLRLAETEPLYREAVANLQQAFVDDPPAVFLSWSVRARAVSTRFAVPAAEPGREVLSTLRLWQPSVEEKRANRN